MLLFLSTLRSHLFRTTSRSATVPYPPKHHSTPPNPPKTKSILSRLQSRHPSLAPLAPQEVARLNACIQAAPDLPEWIWFGLLDYTLSDGRSTLDLEILDVVRDVRGRERLCEVLFYYMYLRVGEGAPLPVEVEEEVVVEGAGRGRWLRWLLFGFGLVAAATAIVDGGGTRWCTEMMQGIIEKDTMTIERAKKALQMLWLGRDTSSHDGG